MSWRHGLRLWLLLVGLAISSGHLARAERPLDEGDLAALRTHVMACRALYEARDQRLTAAEREELSRTDHMRTGLIGVEESRLITTSGLLSAKRTTTHPLWVVVIRNWLRDFGLQPGDRVAIAASGSFPALILAARIAVESLECEPVIIASLSTSRYGASIESFDLWDMEQTLLESGLITTPFRGLSPGGNRDRMHGSEPYVMQHVLRRMEEIQEMPSSTAVRVPATFRESYNWRISTFFEDYPAQVLINIGGHAINFGAGARLLELPAGPIRPGVWDAPDGNSVLLHAVRHNIPVIHLLNVRGLARATDIPYDADQPDVFELNLDFSRRTVESWWAGRDDESGSPEEVNPQENN